MSIETFEDYGIKIPRRRRGGNVKTVCPKCRDTRTHPEDTSLSVNLEMGLWKCHHCGWAGGLKGYDRSQYRAKTRYRKPNPIQETGLSRKAMNFFSLRGIKESTLRKMRIAEGMEFMPQVGKEIDTIQFPYYLEGELTNVKYRGLDEKLFKLTSGAELIPYNIDGIRDKETAIIVEGEMDALSFVEAGYDNVISVPNGANSNLTWLDEFLEGWFDDKETFYIAVDNDEKGLELREELIRRLGAERCMVVTWGDGCKDANEHLVKYGADSLRGRIGGAKDVKIGGVFTAEDYAEELDNIYNGGGLTKGVTIGHPNFDDLVSFETKRLLVVTGEPSSGKSEFIDEMCVRLCLRYGWKTAYFSPENMPLAYHGVKIIEKIGGRKMDTMPKDLYQAVKFYLQENFFHIMPEEDYSVDTILDKARFLVRRKGIKILVLDPFNRIEASAGQSEYEFVRVLLRTLTNFAQRNDLLICLMAHPKKISRESNSEGIPTLNDISGSKDFWNMADFGIVVHRDREEKKVLVRVSKVKYRHLGSEGDAYFKYNVENGRYVPLIDGQPTVYDNGSYLVQSGEERVESFNSPENNYDFLTQGSDEPLPF